MEGLAMKNEKKLWLCQQYAQKAWTLSLCFAQEAGRIGHFGRGYAALADETRTLANKLFEYTGKAKFDGADSGELKGIVDFAFHIGLLSVNAAVEILRVNSIVTDLSVNKSMAVLADDLRNLALDINALADTRVWQQNTVLTEAAAPLKSTYATDFFFRFSIGGIPLVENVANISEIISGLPEGGDMFKIKSKTLPVINCYRHFGLTPIVLNKNNRIHMIIQPDGPDIENFLSNDMYAVPIDDLDINTIFHSKIGCPVPPKGNHALADYARECWDAVGGGQFVFVDWRKVLESA